MPLVKSKSKAAVGENIKREMGAGKPHKQAIAVALNVQRRAKGYAEGGGVAPVPSFFDRVKAALAPTPKPEASPSYNANQVAGQGAVGRAQSGRTETIDNAERKDLGMADGGAVGAVNTAMAKSKERIDAADRATENVLAAPPAAPKPVTAGNGVTAADAEARYKQLTATEAPKPQEKGWLEKAKKAVGMKDGGKVKCAGGGKVSGPGTSRSDSIPARLSKGEYVLPADTAKKVGYGALDALKARTHTPSTPMQRKLAKRNAGT